VAGRTSLSGIAFLLVGDVRDKLCELANDSVQCVVTSPPYWGLRDYGVEGQLGLEPTPELYIEHMVAVFREVRRVLRQDGTLWLNIGDSYARDPAKGGSGPNGKHDNIPDYGNARKIMSESRGSSDGFVGRGDRAPVRVGGVGIKAKDIVGIPWMLAFALRADSWYLRSEIIWHKPNPMPESVTDRPTKAHETIFLLAKSAKYFYDADAIAEPSIEGGKVVSLGEKSFARGQADGAGVARSGNGHAATYEVKPTRNKRSVWTIPPQPFRGAHFATFPEKLVEPCILAGSRPGDLVLDPFAGSCTTAVVALRHSRNFVGTELSTAYAEIARKRVEDSGEGELLI